MKLEDIPAERIADVVSRAVAQAVREGGDPEAIVGRALARAQGELGVDGRSTAPPAAPSAGPATPASPPSAPNGSPPRQVVTEDDVLAARAAGRDELRLSAGALVTPLARDAARDKGVRLVEGS